METQNPELHGVSSDHTASQTVQPLMVERNGEVRQTVWIGFSMQASVIVGQSFNR